MSNSIDVHGLVARWRQEADDMLHGENAHEDQLLSEQKRILARQLEAALRQSGEAVAEMMVMEMPPPCSWRYSYWITDAGRLLPGGEYKLYLAPPATSGLVEALHRCAKALPVLETMLTASALHRGAEVARELRADVTAVLTTRSTK